MKAFPVRETFQKLIFIIISIAPSKRVAHKRTNKVMDVGTRDNIVVLETSSCLSKFLVEITILDTKPEKNT